MNTPIPTLRRHLPRLAVTSALALSGVLASPRADAHFILETPACWMSQDGLGIPEKLGPCGDEGGGTATNIITGFHPGETVTITINEVIYHPGHYRVALATDPSQLPAEPPVTAASTPCGSVPVQSPPVFPVLADGMLDHSAPFSGPQTFTVTLPTNLTCTKCTLQIIEFMSDHPLNNPGGCFYHHCADISIESGQDMDGAAGAGDIDAQGSVTTDDAGGSGTGSSGSPSGSGGGSSGAQSSGGTGQSSGSTGQSSGGTEPAGDASANGATGGFGSGGSSGGCDTSGGSSGVAAAGAGLALFALVGAARKKRRRAA